MGLFSRRPEKRLDELNPEWISGVKDWGLGVAFDCPTHGPPCRLALLFENPVGGYGPDESEDPSDPYRDTRPLPVNGVFYWRIESSFAALTLKRKIELGDHFRGELVDGAFCPSRF